MTESEPPTSRGDTLFEIHDPEIDAGQIMAEIEERIRRRREELGYERRTFPTFGTVVPCPEPPADIPHPPQLYHHLRLANKLFAEPETAPFLAPSPATRLPVLGRLWRLIRDQAHSLVLFYVNRAVAHQVGVNRHLVSALNQLTTLSQEQQRAILALEAELEALRQRLEQP